MEEKTDEETQTKRLPRVNLRILVVCALGLIFGITLYLRIRFGGIRPSDFLFFAVFFVLSLFPLSWKRAGAVGLALLLFGGLGAGAIHLYTKNYESGPEAGTYFVAGTVVSFTVGNGGTNVLLDGLSFDGAPAGGKLSVRITSERVRAGDIVAFETFVTRNDLPVSGNSYAEYLFYSDIRYTSSAAEYNKTGTSANLLLRLNAALFDRLEEGMSGNEAQVAYALLTGNSRGIDEGLLSEVRTGGIAHIFAVSGLHIGILFGAVMLLCRPLRKYAVLPALGAALLYCAFCAFTVSSVRAVVMCAIVGIYRAFGRKYDFLQSVALAALAILIFAPADILSAGFRLSFGACVGLALFAGPLARLFGKIPKFPAFLSNYLSANLAVQLFTFPILLEAFGYFSVWGFVLNLFLIPLLPVFFLTVLLFSLFALVIPPASAVFLAVPKGLLSLFLLVISAGNFSFVLTGFSLGAGAVAIWLIASFLLSEKFRIRPSMRALLAGGLAAVFALFVVFENVVFTGGKISVYSRGAGNAALVQTPSANVLIIEGDIGLADCENFLARRYTGKLDAVLVLADDELAAINRAVFLDTEAVWARDELETGLKRSPVYFGERVEIGGLVFRYFGREKCSLEAEGVVVEFDFENSEALGADLFVNSGSGGLIFSFGNGIIKAI